ncbi:MAG: hypothetical protein CME70_18940 [Halobacteriovorax sp.]|nr:hypothetical protein [Halobacteriovorax sp.]
MRAALIHGSRPQYNSIGNMSYETIEVIGNLILMILVIGGWGIFIWANVTYMPDDKRKDEDEK